MGENKNKKGETKLSDLRPLETPGASEHESVISEKEQSDKSMRRSSDIVGVPHRPEHDECETKVRLSVPEEQIKYVLNENEPLKALLSPGQERAIKAANKGELPSLGPTP